MTNSDESPERTHCRIPPQTNLRSQPLSVTWDLYDQLKQRVARGEASAVVEPLQALRGQWSEPALATLLADALVQLGRPDDALACLQADIEAGIANHWTYYTLGHHFAQLGRLPEAAAAYRRSHALQDWAASEERGYTFSHDYFSGHIPLWRQWFAELITPAPIRILEIGSWQGGSTLWLLDHVIGPRGGAITCVDTWAGSSEHTFLAPLGLSLEALFDANVARSGLGEHVHKRKGRSQDVLPTLHPGSFDLIYIDGAHEAQAVIQDAIHAHRLLAPGGFLLFDDLLYTFADPAQNTAAATDFFCHTFAADYRECHRGAQLLLQRRSSSNLPERLLLVLGMHRSGTSALSGLLCQQGFCGPRNPDPPAADNPTGYWEAPAVRAVHDHLLDQAHSSWDDLLLPPDLWAPDTLASHLHHLEQALQQDFPDPLPGQVALIKDPRQCRLQPLWTDLLHRRHLQAQALLVVRHPLAVARSLQQRNHLPLNRTLLLWLAHTLEAERHSRHLDRRVVAYEELLRAPIPTLQACQALARLPLTTPDPEVLAQWIRPDLNHAPSASLERLAEDPDCDRDLAQLALAVYATLQPLHAQPIPPSEFEWLDRARSRLQQRLQILEQQTSSLLMMQLFWEPVGGGGYTQRNSVRVTEPVGRGITPIALPPFPEEASAPAALRLDPAEQPGVITLQRLALLDAHGEILWQWQAGMEGESVPFAPANSHTAVLDDGQVVGSDHDPSLTLLLSPDVLQRIRGGCHLQLEASWQALPAHLARRLAQGAAQVHPY